ncbi:MAG TPA: M14 family zinc carboxypeptidase [Vicinamibacterales bacterium]
MKPWRGIALLPAIVALMVAAPGGETGTLLTRAERTGFTETSRHDDVRQVLEALSARPEVHLTTFGTSEEGRALPLAVVAAPKVRDAAAARAMSRLRVLVLANIHGGEVEGKEAALILARRLAGGDLRQLLNRLVVLVAPLYNADGNERISVDHRPEQYGPIGGVGTRENARGLDLNRDFTKLEAAESRALARLLADWDPHLVIDLHTTNGSYHGYHLTWAPPLAVNVDPRIADATRDLLESTRRALANRGWRTHSYGNFTVDGALDRERVRVDDGAGPPAWRTFDARPRFVTNGIGLRNRLAILSEAYSYLGFERRVRVTEAFVETILALAARRHAELVDLMKKVDADTATAGARGTLGPLGTRGRLAVGEDGASRILVGEVEHQPHPVTGRPMTVMKEGSARPVLMRDYDRFAPVDPVPAPRAYIVPAGPALSPLVERLEELLARHGIRTARLPAARAVQVEAVVPDTVARTERVFQGHREVRLTGAARRTRTLQAPQGSLIVPMGQPLARLAFHLLEPISDDGVVTWNLVDEWLRDGAEVPIYRVLQPIATAGNAEDTEAAEARKVAEVTASRRD